MKTYRIVFQCKQGDAIGHDNITVDAEDNHDAATQFWSRISIRVSDGTYKNLNWIGIVALDIASDEKSG